MAHSHPLPLRVMRGEILEAVRSTLELWVPYYLEQLDQEHGQLVPGRRTAPPTGYAVTRDLNWWGEQEPPTLIVASRGLVGTPERHGGRHGSYAATWAVSVGVTVGGTDEKGTDDLADRQAAAVSQALIEHEDLGGIAQWTRWRGEKYDGLPPRRTLAAIESQFHVRVQRMADSRGQIPQHPDDPPPPIASATRVRVTTRRTLNPEGS